LALLLAWAGVTAGFKAGAAAQPASAEAQTTTAPQRPRIGLVLSGGGARGLAHVGVLRVLERERVPVDLVVGTSMGAIIGGLYASGMRAEAIERELQAVRWDEVFSPRVARRELSQRRKEQDFELSAVVELGYHDGELRLPQAAVSSRGLESLLRRYTLPVRQVASFDQLPIRFRAIATDMETGAAVELDRGDLALALRSSMSVPGVFAPIEHAGRILGDGGLVDNLPVAVARRLGADIVIAVNVGTPLAGRETLNSVVGLTAQMINILTEQNVQRSLAQLGVHDLLITPALDTLDVSDFDRAAEFIHRGRAAAEDARAALAARGLAAPAYAEWGLRHAAPPSPPPRLAVLRFEGTQATRPERLAGQLESQPGQPFDAAKAERDVRRLAASGDYVRVDYRLQTEPGAAGQDALVFSLEDKPWGPNYLRIGLDLFTDFAGRSAFNLKLAHDRHWLTPSGTEWRNRINLGDSPLIATELYHPLGWRPRLADDWFVAAHAQVESLRVRLYQQGGEVARYHRLRGRLGVDLGQPWGEFGELRLGLMHQTVRTRPELLAAGFVGPDESETWRETGLRARAVIDQLDYALFPQRGFRLEAEATGGRRRGPGGEDDFFRIRGSTTTVGTWGRHTLTLHTAGSIADESGSPLVGHITLGGFHNLSGYESGQLNGNHLLFGRLTWYMRLNRTVVLTRGFFVGATLEAGNVWLTRREISLRDLRGGASAFVGADTGLGPMYLGLTYANRGSAGLIFFIGRP
jgi:NTE family protein